MRCRPVLVWIVTVAAALSTLGVQADDKSSAKRPATTSQAWTLDEAIAALRNNPRDVYLQYVALQLARVDDRAAEVVGIIDAGRQPLFFFFGGNDVDLFALFSGALAVHESLQLETMRPEPAAVSTPGAPSLYAVPELVGNPPTSLPAAEPSEPCEPCEPATEDTEPAPAETRPHPGPAPIRPLVPAPAASAPQVPTAPKPAPVERFPGLDVPPPAAELTEEVPNPVPGPVAAHAPPIVVRDPPQKKPEPVTLDKLSGPTNESHPWKKMLAEKIKAGRLPQVSPLALAVPDDQYFVVFRSVEKLLQTSETSDSWLERLFYRDAAGDSARQTFERLKRQLAIRTDPITRPFYDAVVDEVAVTGSDLYIRESSDVTVLFRIKQLNLFRIRMDGFLDAAAKSRSDTVRSTGKILGVEYVSVTTPDRAVHVFSAYPKPNLHVRSNSEVALRRVIEAVVGKTADGEPVSRLGETDEFRFIRTLMPRGAEEEDGLIYLSDPFIRRLTGPKVKLTERRRMIAYNHLRMIGHAAMLYRTQFGRKPQSLAQLTESGCAPGVFGQGELACPSGGTYRLASDGASGVSSVFGGSQALIPGCEIPLTEATAEEAKEYRQFVDMYQDYWQEYFDPICVRVKVAPKRYRLETLVMPLIDNSAYKSLLEFMGNKPGPLDTLPAPKGSVLGVAFQWGKDKWLAENEKKRRDQWKELEEKQGGKTPIDPELIEKFLTHGIGNQVGFHLSDFPLPLGISPDPGLMEASMLLGGGVYAVLLAPACVGVNVEDAAVVDKFLDKLGAILTESNLSDSGGMLSGLSMLDYYSASGQDVAGKVHCFSIRYGPIRYRLFLARIGNGLYLTNRQSILDDLAVAEKEQTAAKANGREPDRDCVAHAMLQLKLCNAKKLLASIPLGRAEDDRIACLQTQSQLSAIARAVAACGGDATSPQEVRRVAEPVYTFSAACPDGGKYEISSDGRKVACSVHGCRTEPRQPFPRYDAETSHTDLSAVTAALTFLKDGLRAVVTIERK